MTKTKWDEETVIVGSDGRKVIAIATFYKILITFSLQVQCFILSDSKDSKLRNEPWMMRRLERNQW